MQIYMCLPFECGEPGEFCFVLVLVASKSVCSDFGVARRMQERSDCHEVRSTKGKKKGEKREGESVEN